MHNVFILFWSATSTNFIGMFSTLYSANTAGRVGLFNNKSRLWLSIRCWQTVPDYSSLSHSWIVQSSGLPPWWSRRQSSPDWPRIPRWLWSSGRPHCTEQQRQALFLQHPSGTSGSWNRHPNIVLYLEDGLKTFPWMLAYWSNFCAKLCAKSACRETSQPRSLRHNST